MMIRRLDPSENPPWELLELADPSKMIIEGYIHNSCIYVGEESDEIIGVYVLKETKKIVVEIMNVAVQEIHQGRGIGKQLISHAINEASKQGYAQVEIGTGNSSIYQLKLYQQCGFRIVGVDFDYFVRSYDEPIYENGLLCRDMIRLSYTFES
ncbi:GNAT family N-acetyltransferase [Paenisporosarcina sp. TG20]|uniref:GNAT family N-acetyltransferase n=1 Tax=Paenisporosarcina sp. TG20 TaxID=1211706 RepID=UPI0002D7266D|nr:GNAT family N-acetyltransferase [Paenisporosarcina sp. TG20]